MVEFLDGVTLLDYLRARDEGDEVLMQRLSSKGFDRKRFAANVIDNFLGDCFRHGLYHADLHPANLMILDDSVRRIHRFRDHRSDEPVLPPPPGGDDLGARPR